MYWVTYIFRAIVFINKNRKSILEQDFLLTQLDTLFMEDILIAQFEGYNKEQRCFAQCIILIKKSLFSISKIYNISLINNYFACSDIQVNYLNASKLHDADSEYQKSYFNALEKGYTFLFFIDSSNRSMEFYRVPRFSETDFELMINDLGGSKIKEVDIKTPDFLLDNIVLELKDIQNESLYNIDRQKSIAKIFNNYTGYTINLDPSLNLGDATIQYHSLIANKIKNHFKKASKQIKAYKEVNEILGAGIIILNTGMYSLPHDLLKKMVADILERNTDTIEFAFVFSQQMQTNGWNMYANFLIDWVGNVPDRIMKLHEHIGKLVNKKMSEMMVFNNSEHSIESQCPISFELNNKVFYWNPGQLKLPWENEHEN